MKKDPNSPEAEEHTDYSLPKSSILRGQKNFKRLFGDEGIKLYHARNIHIRFRLFPDQPERGCKVGFIVKRRLGKATKRNRMKRLMREAYRTQQHILHKAVENRNIGLHCALIAKNLTADSEAISSDVNYLLHKVHDFILSTTIVES